MWLLSYETPTTHKVHVEISLTSEQTLSSNSCLYVNENEAGHSFQKDVNGVKIF